MPISATDEFVLTQEPSTVQTSQELFPGMEVQVGNDAESLRLQLDALRLESHSWRPDFSGDLYADARSQIADRVERIHTAISQIGVLENPGERAGVYLNLLQTEVWDSFGYAFQAVQEAVDNAEDYDADGSYTPEFRAYRDDILTPVLSNLALSIQALSDQDREKVCSTVLEFARTHFDPELSGDDTVVYDGFRKELVSFFILAEGNNATKYIEGLLGQVIESDAIARERFLSRIDKEKMIVHQVSDYEYFADYELEYAGDLHTKLYRHAVNAVTKGVSEGLYSSQASLGALTVLMNYEARGLLHDYVKAYEAVGVELAYPNLLENLRSVSMYIRRMSAEILYRLEMGKIGITDKEGVRYFDKVYQLAVENDPDFFVRLYRQGNAYVRRIDSSGSIGVFDGQERMLGRFQLQLDTEEACVVAPVREITSKDVFLPKADETPQQRRIRENMLNLYLAGYGKLYDQMEQQTGVRLSSLDLHEQGWFITYFSTAEPARQQELTQFVRTYGELGLKAFLALDYGESGEAILQYAHESGGTEGQQRELFLQFHKISIRAMEWRRVFEQAEATSSYKFSAQLHEALIRKASEYFRASLLVEQGRGGDVTRQELMQSMGQVAFALDALRGLYDKDSGLRLEKPKGERGANPQVVTEYDSAEGEIADALTTWSLVDAEAGTRVVVSVRPVATKNGEARMNFRVVNHSRGIEARIGVDLGDWGLYAGNKDRPYAVSLDLGTGHVDKKNRVYPSQRVGDLLKIVEGSEGGHNEASFGIEAVEYFEATAHAFTTYMEQRYPPITSSF